jgi:hypothetical protein
MLVTDDCGNAKEVDAKYDGPGKHQCLSLMQSVL